MTAAIGINMSIMRSLIIALLLSICTYAWAGHSQNNGTCDDDITHWANMINKRTDAPLYEKSKTIAEVAQKAGSVWQCENFMHEAIRMIKKPYPTE